VPPIPSLPTLRANSAALGSMCGRLVRRSAIASMSKKTAPGMCACANSARASRLSWGMCQEASTTRTLRRPRLAASHSVLTSGEAAGGFRRLVTDRPAAPVRSSRRSVLMSFRITSG
jgi:hypothetical protein